MAGSERRNSGRGGRPGVEDGWISDQFWGEEGEMARWVKKVEMWNSLLSVAGPDLMEILCL
jgi:hypothetical protein